MRPEDLLARLEAGYAYDPMYGQLCNERDQLRAENAKLRELVSAAWKCIHTGASCSDCRLISGGCTLQTAMRELGVEVEP